MTGGFDRNTRRKVIPLNLITKPTGGGSASIELPKTGLLQSIYCTVRFTVAGSLSAPNAIGFASIIRRVQLQMNSGLTLFDVSGAGLYYLLGDMLYDEINQRYAYGVGRTAVSALSSQVMDFIIPVAFNNRDPWGLIMLQNEGTLMRLIVEFEADATVATGATVTATVQPHAVLYEVPNDVNDLPPLNVAHKVQEDTFALSVTGDNDYQVPRGDTLMQMAHLVIGTTATNWSLLLQQTNRIEDISADAMRIRFNEATGRDLNMTGTAQTGAGDRRGFWDMAATDGLGTYGSERDSINTDILTSFISRVRTAGTGTLITLRRTLIPLQV